MKLCKCEDAVVANRVVPSGVLDMLAYVEVSGPFHIPLCLLEVVHFFMYIFGTRKLVVGVG